MLKNWGGSPHIKSMVGKIRKTTKYLVRRGLKNIVELSTPQKYLIYQKTQLFITLQSYDFELIRPKTMKKQEIGYFKKKFFNIKHPQK